jgi:hypothetical protein
MRAVGGTISAISGAMPLSRGTAGIFSASVKSRNCRVATASAIIINPPTKAVVPAMIRVFPRLNSLIGTPKPIIRTPPAAISAPRISINNDIAWPRARHRKIAEL